MLVIIEDENGNVFTKMWKENTERKDAIRWSLESVDLPQYIDENNICKITVSSGKFVKLVSETEY